MQKDKDARAGVLRERKQAADKAAEDKRKAEEDKRKPASDAAAAAASPAAESGEVRLRRGRLLNAYQLQHSAWEGRRTL